MTVAELSPVHLYALVVTAIIYAGWLPLGMLGAYREGKATHGWTFKDNVIWGLGAFALWGMPVTLTLFFTFTDP